MSFPIRLRYEGQSHTLALPLFSDASRSRAWWQALAYVNKTLAPSGASFTLFDEEFVIQYQGGQPHQTDLRILLDALREGLDHRTLFTQRRAA